MNEESIHQEKLKILKFFCDLEADGEKPNRYFTIDSDINEMRFYYFVQQKKINEEKRKIIEYLDSEKYPHCFTMDSDIYEMRTLYYSIKEQKDKFDIIREEIIEMSLIMTRHLLKTILPKK